MDRAFIELIKYGYGVSEAEIIIELVRPHTFVPLVLVFMSFLTGIILGVTVGRR